MCSSAKRRKSANLSAIGKNFGLCAAQCGRGIAKSKIEKFQNQKIKNQKFAELLKENGELETAATF